jgi:hypothetical protein
LGCGLFHKINKGYWLSAPNSLSFTEPKNNLCLFLIWKLQKVYDENPDRGQLSGFGVQKSNKRLSAFFLADGRAFSMRILQ